VTRSGTVGCVAAYKALLGGTYGCVREEAGGLALLSEAPLAKPLSSQALLPRKVPRPRSCQVSSLSREGHIIAMPMPSAQATQSRCPSAPPPMRALLCQATQRRKR